MQESITQSPVTGIPSKSRDHEKVGWRIDGQENEIGVTHTKNPTFRFAKLSGGKFEVDLDTIVWMKP